jgi:hypothetical protein
MRYKIAVSGAAETSHCCDNIEAISKEIGAEIARQGCILVTGATTGAPYFASQGTQKAGGFSIGFSPAASEIEHIKSYQLPLDSFDMMVYTGFNYSGRNLLMTRAADAVVIICGRIGTLNEFTIAYEDGTPVGVLEGSGGTADLIKELMAKPHKKRGVIIFEKDPHELISKLMDVIRQEKGRNNKK